MMPHIHVTYRIPSVVLVAVVLLQTLLLAAVGYSDTWFQAYNEYRWSNAEPVIHCSERPYSIRF